MGDLVNGFLFSNSRARSFDFCQRAYFFAYYGSWGGWERNAPELVRQAYRLKKLQSRVRWAGDVAHWMISDAMKMHAHGRNPDPQQLVDVAYRTMREEWNRSKAGPRTSANHRGFWGLLEHEYGENIPKEKWQENWERTKWSITWWARSRWPAIAAQTARAKAWLSLDSEDTKERIPIFKLNLGQGPTGVVRAIAQPDWAFRSGDALVDVVDWKTGKPKEADWDQVYGYALFLWYRHNIPLDQLRLNLVYLFSGEEYQRQLDELGLQRFLDKATDQVRAMTALLQPADGPASADPDEQEAETRDANKPLPMEAFKMAENPKACASCEFRRLCGRESTTP